MKLLTIITVLLGKIIGNILFIILIGIMVDLRELYYSSGHS